MRILQLSTADLAGGAEKAAHDLFKVYLQRGHESYLAVGLKRSDDPRVLKFQNDERRNLWTRAWLGAETKLRAHKFQGLLRAAHILGSIGEPRRLIDNRLGREDFDFPATSEVLDLPPHRPDVVHAHNLHGGYFDLRLLPELSRQVPVILTLPDAWLMNGHCAHSFGCERWLNGCGHCPDLTIYPALRRDATDYNWQRKQEIYARSRLYVATPSRWLMEKVERSILQPGIVEARVIPYGIDLSVFCPGDKQAARRELGLDADCRVVLFVANKARTNPFKDYALMEEAIRKIAARKTEREIVFLCLGESGEEQRLGSSTIRYVGYESDPAKIARFYQASDIYLHAAKAETFGLVIAEALACGTPVIATATGGIPEIIEHERTGFVVPQGDADALAARIQQILEDEPLRQIMSERAPVSVRVRFDLERMADNYLEWYREILATNRYPLPDAI